MGERIVCETRGGFHASFGRGKPCTLVTTERCGTSSLLELVYGRKGRAFCVILSREGSRAPGACLAGAGRRSVRRDSSLQQLSLRMTKILRR